MVVRVLSVNHYNTRRKNIYFRLVQTWCKPRLDRGVFVAHLVEHRDSKAELATFMLQIVSENLDCFFLARDRFITLLEVFPCSNECCPVVQRTFTVRRVFISVRNIPGNFPTHHTYKWNSMFSSELITRFDRNIWFPSCCFLYCISQEVSLNLLRSAN